MWLLSVPLLPCGGVLGSLVETVWYVRSSRKALRPFMNHLISLYFTSFLLKETERSNLCPVLPKNDLSCFLAPWFAPMVTSSY